MRCFVAVTVGASITDAVAAELGGLRADAEKSGLKASWSLPQGWHATVKFLGDVESEQAENVAARLAEVAASQSPFPVEAAGLVTLPPGARTPNVLAVALRDDGRFAALARRVDEALAHEGFEREGRAFRPHLTLARIRAPRGWREFRPSVERLANRRFGSGEIAAMTLFSSTLGAGPARYDAVATLAFGAGAVRGAQPESALGSQAGPRH